MPVAAPRPGGDIYFEETGQGTPILLVHPAGATASTWGLAVEELARHGRVIVYDRRGYARTDGEPVGTIAAHTADAAALLEKLADRPAVVAGTSIGATIAIDLARLRPDLVQAVVAHESPWHVTRQPPTVPEVAALSKMAWLSRRHREPEAAAAFLRFAYSHRDGSSAWDRFPEEWRRAVSENAKAALADIRIAIGNYPTGKELATVSRPVRCTCGSLSASKMVRVTRKLADRIPTGTFAQIEGAGHAAPFDAPSNFAKTILDALA
jgi:pimeloyl-ACP methyl ester carboxylesterase